MAMGNGNCSLEILPNLVDKSGKVEVLTKRLGTMDLHNQLVTPIWLL